MASDAAAAVGRATWQATVDLSESLACSWSGLSDGLRGTYTARAEIVVAAVRVAQERIGSADPAGLVEVSAQVLCEEFNDFTGPRPGAWQSVGDVVRESHRRRVDRAIKVLDGSGMLELASAA